MQVSNQCMALVNDKIIVPTKVLKWSTTHCIFASNYMIFWSKDAPELAYIVESSEAQYIPDVFFMEKDEYGNEIKKIGRPLPVEYLLIDVPVTTPLQVVVCDCEYLFCVFVNLISFSAASNFPHSSCWQESFPCWKPAPWIQHTGDLVSLFTFLTSLSRTLTPLQDTSVSSRIQSSQSLSPTFMCSFSWPPWISCLWGLHSTYPLIFYIVSCSSESTWGPFTLPWQASPGSRYES